MKSIEEFLAGLSPEERKRHSALIRECLTREEDLTRGRGEIQKNMDRLNRNMYTIQARLAGAGRELVGIGDEVAGISTHTGHCLESAGKMAHYLEDINLTLNYARFEAECDQEER